MISFILVLIVPNKLHFAGAFTPFSVIVKHTFITNDNKSIAFSPWLKKGSVLFSSEENQYQRLDHPKEKKEDKVQDKKEVKKEEDITNMKQHQRLHYPTAGGMFDVSVGPSHHLVGVDHEKLKDLENKPPSVNVHEVKVDAVTVTFFSFALALCVFILAMDETGLMGSYIAKIQNTFT